MVMLVVAFTLNLDFSLLASEMTHEFKNPAFSRNGYSSHVLSINQLEVQRKQGVIDDLKSAAAAAERAEKNKTVNKFIANVESRIYMLTFLNNWLTICLVQVVIAKQRLVLQVVLLQ